MMTVVKHAVLVVLFFQALHWFLMAQRHIHEYDVKSALRVVSLGWSSSSLLMEGYERTL